MPPRRQQLHTDPSTSARLGRIRQHGTAAELTVRRIAHSLGLRYRVHNRDLPGSPDLANRLRRWAVFVHGCFWHRHVGCKRTTIPKANREFWLNKFEQNVRRDRAAIRALRRDEWVITVVWECEIEESPHVVARRLTKLKS